MLDTVETGSTGTPDELWLSPSAPYVATIAGENISDGFVSILGGDGGRLAVDSIGMAGASGRLGTGTMIRMGNGSGLRYTGAGETTDRTIMMTNTGSKAEGVIEHNGTGVLTWSGVVSQQWETAALVLAGSSAAGGVFSGVLAANSYPEGSFVSPELSLTKRGTTTWTLTAENDYTGTTKLEQGTLKVARGATLGSTSGITFAGGTLEFEGGDGAQAVSLPATTVTAAGSSLKLGSNVSATLASRHDVAVTLRITMFSGGSRASPCSA